MRTALILPLLLLAACALFLRSYTLPPAPTAGRHHAPADLAEPPGLRQPPGRLPRRARGRAVLPCLIASVARARDDGYTLLQLPFCAACYDLSGRIAVMGGDAAATRARLEQIARFGW